MTRSRPRAAIILAAGESRRMGRPKALLVVAGRALVAQHVERFAAAGCATITVVARRALAAEVTALVAPRALVVEAETTSQGASLAIGAGASMAGGVGTDAVVFVTPVDLIPPGAGVLEALAAALEEGFDAATPTLDGRGGHPVALVGESLGLLARLGDQLTLRGHLAELAARRARVPVDDPRILGDLDQPRDLTAMTGVSTD